MEKFELRQDERDERRHAESVKSQAVTFISKNYANRGLIPLCAIAAMHNDKWYYSREMYREFCCMTREVQNCILEYCSLDLRVDDTDGLFAQCISKLEDIVRDRFPGDSSVFYDGGKYVLRSLEDYGVYEIPVKRIPFRSSCTDGIIGESQSDKPRVSLSYESYMEDALRKSFHGEGSKKPVSKLARAYGFREESEIVACQFATTLARFISLYGGKDVDPSKEYGSPGGYAGETIDTMEDLFLLAMYAVYTRLII